MMNAKLLGGMVLLATLLPMSGLRAGAPSMNYENYATTRGLMKQGVQLLKQRRLNDAKARFEQCLKQIPDHYEAHFFLSELAYENRDYGAALEHVQTAIRSLENLGKAYEQLSIANQKRIAAARDSIQLSLDWIMDRSGGGGGGCNAGTASDDRMALQELDQAATTPFAGESPFAIPAVFYGLKGNCLLRLQRNADSREQYEKAIKADPDYPEAWNNLAYLWYSEHDAGQALQILQRAAAKGVTVNPALKVAILDAANKNNAN